MIRQVKPYEIPLRLLKQKTAWDLEEFYRCSMVVTNWNAYVWGECGEEWAAMILVEDPIYNSIVLHTLIVDRKKWSQVPDVLKAMWQEMEAFAKSKGRRYISAFSFAPDRHLKMLGNPEGIQKLETRLRKEVA